MKSSWIRDNRGLTLAELMVASALMGILVLTVVPLFKVSQSGFTSFEAQNSMKSGAQKAVNRIQRNLIGSKRLFENNANDTALLARITLNAGTPSPMTGYKLPSIEENGALSPGSTAYVFVSTSVGNALFFASIDNPQDVTVDVTGTGTMGNVRIDTYHFNFYYPSLDTNNKKISGQTIRRLREWHSVSYADYEQLTNLPSGPKRTNTVIALYNAGLRYSWNASTTNVNAAFYTISNTGAITASAAHTIPQQSSADMIDIMRNITMGGYHYSVSPNTGSNFPASITVPLFATSSSQFPSGFEVVAVGANSARQVFIRLVLAAEGSFRGILSVEQVVLTTVRDLW